MNLRSKQIVDGENFPDAVLFVSGIRIDERVSSFVVMYVRHADTRCLLHVLIASGVRVTPARSISVSAEMKVYEIGRFESVVG